MSETGKEIGLEVSLDSNGTEAVLRQMVTQLKAVGDALTQMATKAKTAEDKTESLKNKLRQQYQTASQNAANLQLVAAGMERVGKIGVAAAVGPAKAFADLDRSLAAMAAKAGISRTSEEFLKLKRNAEDVARTSRQFSTVEVVDAQRELAAAGFGVNDQLVSMQAFANAALIENRGLAESADAVAGAMAAYGAKAEQAGYFTDVLAATSGAARGDLFTIAEGFKVAAREAANLGESVETTSAMLATLDEAGFQGAQGGTMLRNIMAQLASPQTKHQKKILKQLGVTTKDEHGNFLGMEPVMANLSKALSDPSIGSGDRAGMLKRLFGVENMVAAQVLLDAFQGGENGKYRGYKAKVTGVEGYASQKAAEITRNASADIQAFEKQLESFKQKVGELIAGPGKWLLEFAGGVVDSMTLVANEFPGLTAGLVGLAGGFGAILLVGAPLVSAMGMASMAMTTLQIQATMAANGIGAMSGVGLAGSIGTLATAAGIAVIALGAVAASLYAFDKFKKLLDLEKANEEEAKKRVAGAKGVATSVYEGVLSDPANAGSELNALLEARDMFERQAREAKESYQEAFGNRSLLDGGVVELERGSMEAAQTKLEEFDRLIQEYEALGPVSQEVTGEITVRISQDGAVKSVTTTNNSGPVKITTTDSMLPESRFNPANPKI